jgi:heparanase 1
MQLWEFRPLPAQASLRLKTGSEGAGNGASGPCLNVADFGKSVGDNVWVTKCHEEEPWKANDGWTFTKGQLLNTRSKLCATESQQQQLPPALFGPRQASRHTVLGACTSAQHWVLDAATGLLKNTEIGGCLTVGKPSRGPPPPPGPGREPSPPFPPHLPAPTTVASTLVLGGRPIARSGGDRYASFNFDWHCGASDAEEYDCRAEPGWNHSSVNFGLDLSAPALVAAAKALAPGRLRIGGSQGDCICYDIPAGSCAKVMNASGTSAGSCDSKAFILNMTRWQQIVDFARDTGVELVFGLNGATRRDGGTPLDWEVKNTRAFVEYVSSHNAKQIYGFELGNEKCGKIDPTVYANDIRELDKIVDAHWMAGQTKPLVIGPDCNPISGDWVTQFLRNASDVLNVYTYHNYVGYGLDPQLAPKIMDPSGKFFDSGPGRAHAMIDGWERYGAPHGMEIWVGEIAAAWHSGEPGVTNRFISSFWYADALGLLATINHTGFCRQTLIGGNYGLLNRTTGEPNPDFYMAQMFHDRMGTRVLNLSASMHSEGLRSYAHCDDSGGKGAATLLLINVSPTVTFAATLPPPTGLTTESPEYEIYEFSAGDGSKAQWNGLDSQHIAMNGAMLRPGALGALPALRPRLSKDAAVEVKPLTISFVGVAGVAACA